MLEDTYTSERQFFILRICIVNYCHPMWYALIQCANLKSHIDLIHLFYWSIFFIQLIRVNYRVLVIFIELIIIYLKTFEVVVE